MLEAGKIISKTTMLSGALNPTVAITLNSLVGLLEVYSEKAWTCLLGKSVHRAHMWPVTHFELQFAATPIGLRDVWRVHYAESFCPNNRPDICDTLLVIYLLSTP